MTRVSIAAALCAVLLWLASPAVGAGWLAWVAIVPVAVVVLGSPGTRAARLAVPLAYAAYLELLLVPALPFGIAENQWGDAAVPVMIGDSPVIPVALVAIPLFGLLLYLVRFGEPWGAERLSGRGAALAAVAVPACAWAGLDLVRAKLEPGGSWGPLFLTQIDTPASTLAVLGGPWLVTIAIVAVNYGLALALARRRLAPALVPAAAVAASVLALPAIGPEPGDRSVRVAAVQPGYDTADFERRELRHWRAGEFNLAARDVIRDLGALTRGAARDGAELVVWPEAVAFVDLRKRRAARARVARVARRTGAAIVAPYFNHSSRRGAAFAVRPDGTFTGPRAKRRAMWFLGERGGYPAPEGPLGAGGVRVGTLLGVDVQDPNVARAHAARGAELIASSTHDWRQLATQHRALSALAAEASRAPLVRSDWRYGSAIYDRDGSAVADAGGALRRAAIVADVELAGGPTPYARIGDVVGWIALAVAIAAWLAAGGAALATRAGGRASGGRAPRRGPHRPRPAPAPPPADDGPSPPPA